MTTTTTRPADDGKSLMVRQLDTVKDRLDRYAPALAQVMPREANAQTFMGLAMSAVRRDRNLLAASIANPHALIYALRRCAYLGHVPGERLFALVPFNDKNADGGKTIVGIEEWRGVVQRMFRTGRVMSIKVNTGREGDEVLRFNPTTMDVPHHEYDEFAAPDMRGRLKVAYAWAILPGGIPSQVAWLPRYEIAKRRAKSRSGDAFWGPVDEEGPNTEGMWRKSALHASEGMIPTSPEWRIDADTRLLAADREFPDIPAAADPIFADWEGEVIDG